MKQIKIIERIRDKEARAERKRIRNINRSIVATGSKTQKNMGLYGVQLDDGVFYLANGNYIKVYIAKFKTREASDKKNLIEAIAAATDERTRITMLRKKDVNGEISNDTFICFHTYAKTYYEATLSFTEKESKFRKRSGGTGLLQADMGRHLSFIKEYFLQEEGDYNVSESIRKNRDWNKELIPKIERTDKYFKGNEKFYEGYLVTQFNNQPERIWEAFEKAKCPIYGVIDMEPISESEKESYEKTLEIGFNQKLEIETADKFNVTIAYLLEGGIEDQLGHEYRKLKRGFNANEVMISACNEMTRELMESLVTFGIKDYRAMRIMKKDYIREFVF